jgi:hypothetical protein
MGIGEGINHKERREHKEGGANFIRVGSDWLSENGELQIANVRLQI